MTTYHLCTSKVNGPDKLLFGYSQTLVGHMILRNCYVTFLHEIKHGCPTHFSFIVENLTDDVIDQLRQSDTMVQQIEDPYTNTTACVTGKVILRDIGYSMSKNAYCHQE